MTDRTLVQQFIDRSRTHIDQITDALSGYGIKELSFSVGSGLGYAAPDDIKLMDLYNQIKEANKDAKGVEEIDKGMLVVPFGDDYFMFLDGNDMKDMSALRGAKISHVQHFYNLNRLYDDEITDTRDPVFLCTSIVDCLIYRSLSERAIYVSDRKMDLFIAQLNERPTSHPLIVVQSYFGNNTSEKTMAMAEYRKLARTLDDETGLDVRVSTLMDANPQTTYLSELFVQNPLMIKNAIRMDRDSVDNTVRDDIKKYRDERSVGPQLPLFKQFILAASNRRKVPSGFPNLDEVLGGGFAEGLYIIGAPSSTGKTTLCIQMADYISKTNDVLFFTLEQSTKENIAKSLSRLTFELGKEPKEYRTHSDIMYGSDKWSDVEQESFDRAYATYERMVTDRLFYFEKKSDVTGEKPKTADGKKKTIDMDEIVGRRIGVWDVEQAIVNHLELCPESQPVVFIDYIQVLAPVNVKYSDKQNIDAAVSQLRYIAAHYHTPIIAISSLNRQSTDTNLGMNALSGSGNLEYGADVVMILQSRDLSKKTSISAMNSNRIQNDAMKESIDRELELAIRKNRYGRCRTVYYDFNSMFSSFRPAYPKDDDEDNGTGSIARF